LTRAAYGRGGCARIDDRLLIAGAAYGHVRRRGEPAGKRPSRQFDHLSRLGLSQLGKIRTQGTSTEMLDYVHFVCGVSSCFLRLFTAILTVCVSTLRY
jgi:hypothetical protein